MEYNAWSSLSDNTGLNYFISDYQCLYLIQKKVVLELLPTLLSIDGEFRVVLSIQTPQLSDPIVCLPLSSDNPGSTVHVYKVDSV